MHRRPPLQAASRIEDMWAMRHVFLATGKKACPTAQPHII